ncbi:cilia- and flagella-associated protein 251 [Crocuta crocuta]
MSGAGEDPLEETEKDGDTRVEEEEEEEEEEDYSSYYREAESMLQDLKEDDIFEWGKPWEEEEEEEEGEEEGEEKGGVEEKWEKEAVREKRKERAAAVRTEVAVGVQEETTAKPQEITKSKISVKKLPLTDSQAGTFLPSRKLGENADQLPQDELGQGGTDLEAEKGERIQDKRSSYLSEEKEKEFQPKTEMPKESLVATSKDILFQKNDRANAYPLTLTWSFGWNSSLPVYYIRDENQRVLLYVCAHNAVIYNVLENNQHHLQGHPNMISCLCVSEDRRWIATADKGPDCLIIIWDSFTGIPVHTIFDSCPEGNGIRAIAITWDAKYLATISDAEIQKVCIWRWTLAVETPACTLDLPKEYGFQNYLTFNPTNNKELVSNSKTQAIYYLWYEEEGILAHSAPRLTEKTFNKLVGRFSQSVFHLNLTQILSATMEGKLVVWDIYRPPSSASASPGFPYIKPCKLVHLQKEGITVLTTVDRKTLLGPVYGSSIEQVQILPVKSTLDLQKRYMVFINRDKVGLQILPIDGNPHKTSAIICHPSGVAGMALSYDGCYAFTAGGRDRSVVQWEINLSALEAAVSLGGEDLTPFYGLVAGGREGKFYRELEDYFYYSQLRSQGIDTMETRKVSEHICLSELPFVMRAIGFYPSEEKIEDMFNEVRFSEYVDTGKLIDKINLPDFFKVYLNHRPPFGNTTRGIQDSFNVLGFTSSSGKKVIRREDFLKLLLTKGEHMTEEEMCDCFATLFGLNPEGWKSEPAASSVKGSEICFEEQLPDEITAEIFATDILGLTVSQDFRQDPMVSEVVRNA